MRTASGAMACRHACALRMPGGDFSCIRPCCELGRGQVQMQLWQQAPDSCTSAFLLPSADLQYSCCWLQRTLLPSGVDCVQNVVDSAISIAMYFLIGYALAGDSGNVFSGNEVRSCAGF